MAESLGMALLTRVGSMSPTLFVLALLPAGVTTAAMAPIQQSLVPLMVARPELRAAIALDSIGFNVSRAIGPAIGGVIVATVGVAFNFFVDATSHLVVILAVWWWKEAATPASNGAPEQLGPAMVAGVRFAWHAPALHRVMLRAGSFFVFASAYWALLPFIARQELGGRPTSTA